jgi:hypothetical protein
MRKALFSLVLLGLLAGCQQNDSGDQSMSLEGSWITNACVQATDINDNPLDFWAKGLYEFHDNGSLVPVLRAYSNSSCTGAYEETILADIGTAQLSYFELGTLTLEEGIDGGEFTLTMVYNNEALSTDGFYTVNGNELCLSANIRLDPIGITTSQVESTAIDFENCLTRVIRLGSEN